MEKYSNNVIMESNNGIFHRLINDQFDKMEDKFKYD